MKLLTTLFVTLFLSMNVSFASVTPPKDALPFVHTKIDVTIVVPESFMDPNDLAIWDQIDTGIRTESGPNTDFTLEVQGDGGDVMALNRTIAAIEYAKMQGSKITMIVVGPAYSAHAFLTCYADDLFLSPNGSLMFHDMKSWYNIGPFIIASDSGMDVNMQALENGILNQCINQGILSKQETINILNGKEISILPDGKHVSSSNRYNFMFTVESFLFTVMDYAWYAILLSGLIFSIFFGIRKGLGK